MNSSTVLLGMVDDMCLVFRIIGFGVNMGVMEKVQYGLSLQSVARVDDVYGVMSHCRQVFHHATNVANVT